MTDTRYIEAYYSRDNEDARLSSRNGSVEYLTTMRYIQRCVSPGASILEVGAGTGRYSLSLARMGYKVTAVELVAHNIEVFKRHLLPADDIALYQGNALDLSRFEDNAFDAVLLLGPLYHLYNDDDKCAALCQAKRVLKPDGTLFAAYCLNEATVIQWAFADDGQNMLDCMARGMLTPDYKCISKPEDLFEMVRSEDITRLNARCGLIRQTLVGTDMFTKFIAERVDAWRDEVFNAYLAYHFSICERSDLIGLGNHALDILKKAE